MSRGVARRGERGKTFAVAAGAMHPSDAPAGKRIRHGTYVLGVGNVTYLSRVFTYRIDARRGRTFIPPPALPELEFRCGPAWPRLDSTRFDSTRLDSTRLDSGRRGAARCGGMVVDLSARFSSVPVNKARGSCFAFG